MKVSGSLFLIAVSLLLLGPLTVCAQSGRKAPAARPAPTPPSVKLPEGARTAGPKETPKPEPIPADAKILVAGEVVHDYAYYSSSDLGTALKECVYAFRSGPMIVDAAKLGKLDFTEAKDRARQQTDAYILWISFVTTQDDRGNMRVAYADYAMLMPKTGDRLTFGRLKPNARTVVGTGGILGLPTPSRPRNSPVQARLEMKDIARQIPAILGRGGWLGR